MLIAFGSLMVMVSVLHIVKYVRNEQGLNRLKSAIKHAGNRED